MFLLISFLLIVSIPCWTVCDFGGLFSEAVYFQHVLCDLAFYRGDLM